ncbi:MAG: chemoreceptor glutamine deamidase CheD [Candidatus Pelagadaptatus aseana]|uniref:chemoreceptor glutamine deamidase CheD n=1 Tax=Candidatus Pelagadaptatus aseana TaxID=3120508 RepID=UPI0039B21857
MNNQHPLPKPLPGFEHVNRYWDRQQKVPAAKILPGQFYISAQGEMISTVLGSCISACIRDKRLGIGGMNHFMLPESADGKGSWETDSVTGASSRYGNWAMEYLINAIIKQGGKKSDMEVKLFGGGAVLANMSDVGARNIEFARSYLEQEGLTITAQDVGGPFPRKVLYFPDTGSVKMRKLKTQRNDTVERREKEYIQSITSKPAAGDVELF